MARYSLRGRAKSLARKTGSLVFDKALSAVVAAAIVGISVFALSLAPVVGNLLGQGIEINVTVFILTIALVVILSTSVTYVPMSRRVADSEKASSIKIAELQKASSIKIAELQKAVSTDHLTQVLGEKEAEEKLREAVQGALKDKEPLSLIMADIDGFKQINDTYSYEVGNSVLKEFAQTLQMAVRDPKDALYRLHGDEFLVIAPGTEGVRGRLFAERLLRVVRETPFQLGSLAKNVSLTMSAGVTELLHERDKGDTIEETIRTLNGRLDAALKTAKQTKDMAFLLLTNPKTDP